MELFINVEAVADLIGPGYRAKVKRIRCGPTIKKVIQKQ